MKKITAVFSLLVAVLTVNISQAQVIDIPEDSVVYIAKLVDEMSDRVYYSPSKAIVLRNEKQGFRVELTLTGKSERELKVSGIDFKSVGVGNCMENDTFIILFENGEKISRKSWQKFNCEGRSYFDLTDEDIEKLATLPVAKIRLENGRDYKSMTGEVPKSDRNYFVQAVRAYRNKDIRTVKM